MIGIRLTVIVSPTYHNTRWKCYDT